MQNYILIINIVPSQKGFEEKHLWNFPKINNSASFVFGIPILTIWWASEKDFAWLQLSVGSRRDDAPSQPSLQPLDHHGPGHPPPQHHPGLPPLRQLGQSQDCLEDEGLHANSSSSTNLPESSGDPFLDFSFVAITNLKDAWIEMLVKLHPSHDKLPKLTNINISQ